MTVPKFPNNPITVDVESIGSQLISGQNTTVRYDAQTKKVAIDVPNSVQPGGGTVITVDSNTDPAIVGQMYWCMNRQGVNDKQVTIWFQGYSNPNMYDIRFPSYFQYGYSIQQTQCLPEYGTLTFPGKSTQNFLIPAIPMTPAVGGIGFTGCVVLTGM